MLYRGRIEVVWKQIYQIPLYTGVYTKLNGSDKDRMEAAIHSLGGLWLFQCNLCVGGQKSRVLLILRTFVVRTSSLTISVFLSPLRLADDLSGQTGHHTQFGLG